FFFNDTATTEIYTLSLHDALPIWSNIRFRSGVAHKPKFRTWASPQSCTLRDRKSTRLNSSHTVISYAFFCLKKRGSAILGDAKSRAAPTRSRCVSQRADLPTGPCANFFNPKGDPKAPNFSQASSLRT